MLDRCKEFLKLLCNIYKTCSRIKDMKFVLGNVFIDWPLSLFIVGPLNC